MGVTGDYSQFVFSSKSFKSLIVGRTGKTASGNIREQVFRIYRF